MTSRQSSSLFGNAEIIDYKMKVEGRNRRVNSRGLQLISGLQPIFADLRLPEANLERSLRTVGEAIVNGCLRSPSATRLSGKLHPRLSGFASLPRNRFAFIGAIIFKRACPPHEGERTCITPD